MAYFNYAMVTPNSLVLKGNPTMANEQKGPTPVEKAENLLRNLKTQAEDAHKAKDDFTLGLMTELIKVTSPIVTKAVNRYHREERARINALRKDLRGQSPNQSGPKQTTNLGD
jgi:hypothetical protein